MRIKSEKDFFSGLFFTACGIAFAGGSFFYRMGTASQMGPGYFPFLLGILLTVLGIAIVLRALVAESGGEQKIGSWAWKPLVFILAANLAFGALLTGLPSIRSPRMGLIAAIFALTIIASMAGDRPKIREVLILATILAVGSYVAFVVLLDLQIPVWPGFVTG